MQMQIKKRGNDYVKSEMKWISLEGSEPITVGAGLSKTDYDKVSSLLSGEVNTLWKGMTDAGARQIVMRELTNVVNSKKPGLDNIATLEHNRQVAFHERMRNEANAKFREDHRLDMAKYHQQEAKYKADRRGYEKSWNPWKKAPENPSVPAQHVSRFGEDEYGATKSKTVSALASGLDYAQMNLLSEILEEKGERALNAVLQTAISQAADKWVVWTVELAGCAEQAIKNVQDTLVAQDKANQAMLEAAVNAISFAVGVAVPPPLGTALAAGIKLVGTAKTIDDAKGEVGKLIEDDETSKKVDTGITTLKEKKIIDDSMLPMNLVKTKKPTKASENELKNACRVFLNQQLDGLLSAVSELVTEWCGSNAQKLGLASWMMLDMPDASTSHGSRKLLSDVRDIGKLYLTTHACEKVRPLIDVRIASIESLKPRLTQALERTFWSVYMLETAKLKEGDATLQEKEKRVADDIVRSEKILKRLKQKGVEVIQTSENQVSENLSPDARQALPFYVPGVFERTGPASRQSRMNLYRWAKARTSPSPGKQAMTPGMMEIQEIIKNGS